MIRYGKFVVKHVPGVLMLREFWTVTHEDAPGDFGSFQFAVAAKRAAAALSMLTDEQLDQARRMALGEEE